MANLPTLERHYPTKPRDGHTSTTTRERKKTPLSGGVVVTGPDGFFGMFFYNNMFEDDLGVSSLRSIYAPRLTGTQSLEVAIGGNPNLAEVDLCALKEAGEIVIFENPELVDVKLSELTTVTNAFEIRDTKLEQLSLPKLRTTTSLEIYDNENLVGISIPVLETSSFQFEVFDNPSLQTLCAPNLVDGDSVCIGNNQNQPFLDADLSELVDGSFSSATICYQDSDASTVCGRDDGGLFSTDGCPSSACPTADE
ncbi:receptor L-domain domain-containing protein [Pseudoscourfieldia marina]